MSDRYKPEVIKVLKDAGWYEGRAINTDAIVDAVRSNGFPEMQPLIPFLKEYGGLKFAFHNLKSNKTDDFDFDVNKAMEIIVAERCEPYLTRIGCEGLSLIGTAYREHIILMMDENGKVYGSYENFLTKMGNNIEEAIEGIILNYGFQDIA